MSLFHNRRSKECNHGKQDANRVVFHNRGEYWIEIHTLSLTIALCNQACEEFLIQRLRSWNENYPSSSQAYVTNALMLPSLKRNFKEARDERVSVSKRKPLFRKIAASSTKELIISIPLRTPSVKRSGIFISPERDSDQESKVTSGLG